MSCDRFWKTNVESFATSPFIVDLNTRLYGANDYDRKRFSDAYDRHVSAVAAYFKNRPKDLLLLDIFTSPNPWEPICNFLNATIPAQPFPHQNRTHVVEEILLRLLAATGSVQRTAEITETSATYIAELMQKGRKPDFSQPLPLDGGLEAILIVRRLLQGMGIGVTAQVLGVNADVIRRLTGTTEEQT